MKFKRDEKYERIAVYSVLSALILFLIYFVFTRTGTIKTAVSNIFAFLSPFIYGFVFAYLANPIMMFFERKIFRFKKPYMQKCRRPLSVVCTVILIILFAGLFLWVLIPQVAESYTELQSQIGGYITAAQSWASDFVENSPLFNGKYEMISDFLDVDELAARLKALISESYKYLSNIANYIASSAGRLMVELSNIGMGFILAIYFLLSKEKLIAQIKKMISSFLSRKNYINLISLTRYTDRSFGQFIRGKMLDSLIIGLLTFVVLWSFSFPFYPLIALIVGVTNMIPMFGPIIGAVPCIFLLLIADPVKALWFILIIVIIQQLDGNIIGPKILGNVTGLSALWIVVAITVGGSLFGVIGMFLAVPAFSVIYALIRENTNRRLKRRSQPVSTSYYAEHPDKSELPEKTIFADPETEKKKDPEIKK